MMNCYADVGVYVVGAVDDGIGAVAGVVVFGDVVDIVADAAADVVAVGPLSIPGLHLRKIHLT